MSIDFSHDPLEKDLQEAYTTLQEILQKLDQTDSSLKPPKLAEQIHLVQIRIKRCLRSVAHQRRVQMPSMSSH